MNILRIIKTIPDNLRVEEFQELVSEEPLIRGILLFLEILQGDPNST